MLTLRSILAATDLTVGCDVVLQTAAALARRAGAELHVVHVASTWDATDSGPDDALASQISRVFGASDAVETSEVVHDRPFHGILVQAAKVHADLVVVGPAGRSGVSARFTPTTAERVVRTAEVPCLVVRSPLTEPVQHFGVATDFSPASRGAVDLAADWAPVLGAGDVRLSLVHVASRERIAEAPAALDAEKERAQKALADAIEGAGLPANGVADRVSGHLLEDNDAASAVTRWAEQSVVQCLVAVTQSRSGVDRLWSGSRAGRLVQEAPCSVMLVPPTFWRREPIDLARIGVALPEDDAEARRWMAGRIDAAHRPLVGVPVDATGDVVEDGWDAGADLLVVRGRPGDGNRGSGGDAGTVDLLERAVVPMLILRDLPKGPIEHVLIAVDTGEIWYEKFGWAKLLCDRFGADVTIFYPLDLSFGTKVRRVPGGEFVPSPTTWMNDDVERTVIPAMRAWIWERVRMSGLPADRVEVVIAMQDPWYAIPTLARKIEADLVVAAAHSKHSPGRASLSTVTKAVLDGGSYSVLAVVDRLRAYERAAEDTLSRQAQ
jgi:nucleotide-binding universal stress UspA family protein